MHCVRSTVCTTWAAGRNALVPTARRLAVQAGRNALVPTVDFLPYNDYNTSRHAHHGAYLLIALFYLIRKYSSKGAVNREQSP